MGLEAKKSDGRESRLFTVLETLIVVAVFVLMARLWPINQHLVFFLVWAGLVGYTVWRGPVKLRHSVVGYVPLGLMGVVFAIMASSSLWAPEMWRTFSYSVFSFLHFLIGVTVAVAFPLARIVGGLILSVVGVAVYGLILGLVDPSRGFTDGLLMGEFTNSSEISHFLGAGLVLVLSVVRKSIWQRLALGFLVVGFALYLQYLGYLTSIVATLAAVWVYLWIALVRRSDAPRRIRLIGVGATITATAVAVLWVFREPLQIAAGKTPDFSGRIPFWEHFWSLALANPWGGLGWGWLTWLPPGEEIPHPVQEFFPAHQGYIEFAYMLGIPAMVLVIVVLLFVFVRSFWSASLRTENDWLMSSVPALVMYLSVFDLAATFHTRTVGMFFLGLLVVLGSGLLDREYPDSIRRGAPHLEPGQIRQ